MVVVVELVVVVVMVKRPSINHSNRYNHFNDYNYLTNKLNQFTKTQSIIKTTKY